MTGDDPNRTLKAFLLPALFILISCVYCTVVMRQGWIPQDEGVLAQTAERFLDGEVPHRDFDEPYSGGLTWLNACAFQFFGVRLLSLRIPLLAFYSAFLSVLYCLARRWLKPLYAGLFVLSSLGWGLPAYFAALPSWYLCIFSGYGTLLLMKHVESGRRLPLFAAGVMGGVSICFKTLGIYYVLAGCIFLLYRETALSLSQPDTRDLRPLSNMYRALKLLMSLTVLALLTAVFWKRLDFKEGVYFLLPAAVVTAIPFLWEASSGPESSGARLKRLCTLEVTFLAGVAVPLALFAFAFWSAHALRPLFEGLFVLPSKRYQYAFYPLPPLWTFLAALPVAALYLFSARDKSEPPRWCQWPFLIGLVSLALAGSHGPVYHFVWATLRTFVPLMAILTGVRLLDHSAGNLSLLKRQQLFLVVIVAVFVSLVQFPDSFGIYFFYTAPFAALAGLAVFKTYARRLQNVSACVLLSYALFGFLWISRGEADRAGENYVRRDTSARLLPERAGLQIDGWRSQMYETLVREIRTHSAGSNYMLAGPDCPQVYFLAGEKNPTRIFYEFFAPEHASMDVLLKAAREHHVKVVVLNGRPQFSPRVSKEFYRAIAKRYPHFEDIGTFRLFWRTE